MNLFLAEDDASLQEILAISLRKRGHEVTLANDGVDALLSIKEHTFDLLILDVMLPKLSGWDLAETVRKFQSRVPILFITAKGEKEDMIQSYISGGNDFLRKPFHLEELFFRIEELGKRTDKMEQFQLGKFTFNPVRQELSFLHSTQILSHKESALLHFLCQKKGELLPRKEVLLALWGDDDFFSARNMDAYISKLRKRLKEDENVQILNIRGLGYKLIA